MFASTGPLTVGTIIGTAFLVIALVTLLVVYVAWVPKLGRKDKQWFKRVIPLAAVLLIFGYVFFMWPFKYDYHHWVNTTGVVASVSSRVITDSDGNINQKYVIRFEDGRVRALNDTIGGVLTKGDPIDLRCKKAFEWSTPSAAHGWDCKYSGARP